MKKIILILTLFIFCVSNAQNEFFNPNKHIEYLKFGYKKNDGMYLKLTLAGIKYAKSRKGCKNLAKDVSQQGS